MIDQATSTSSAFGKYTIVRRLGAGGMAEVFLCRLAGIGGFDKRVVVKRILSCHVGNKLYVDMFLDEARVAANLSHPNIVQIFEIGNIDGAPYIAMEYVRGPTLIQVLRAAVKLDRLAIGPAVKILAGVCEGLEHAHHAVDPQGRHLGIVHRDISPDNILISGDGTPRVFDFGIARAEGRLVETRIGSLKGKLAYMPPEQLRGQVVDRRADIFAVGVCLFEATVGRRLFTAPSEVDLYSLRMAGVVPRPSTLVPGYPPELEQIVMAALEPDPDRRTPSCRVLADQLDEFVAHGAHAASAKTVVAWIASLAPALEPVITDVDTGRGEPAAKPTSRPPSATADDPGYDATLQASTPVPEPQTPAEPLAATPAVTTPPGRSRRGTIAAVAIAAVLAVAVIVVVVHPWSRTGAGGVTSPPAPVADSEQLAAAAATTYLDEAERLIAKRKYQAATGLLDRVGEVNDPALYVRSTHLRERARVGALAVQARAALVAGDAAAAIEAAKGVLDSEPDDAEALEILAAARGLAQPAPPADASGAPPATGTITIRAAAGALVYVDDEPMGPAPLHRRPLATGTHTVEIRQRGVATVRKTARIVAGDDWSFDLPGAPAAAGVEPAKVAAVVAPTAPATEPPVVATVDAGVPAPVARITPADLVAPAEPKVKPAPAAVPPPAVVKPLAPRLPAAYTARSLKEVEIVLATIEKEAVERGGVEAAAVRGSTRKLAEAIFSDFSPGTPINLKPRAIFYFIVERARAGKAAGATAAELASAFAQGSL